MRKLETEVLVVGAGPAGLLTALRLLDRGVRVEIIDEQWRPAGHSYALGLHASTLELLDGLGVAQDVVAAGRRIPALSIFEKREQRAKLPLGEGSRFPFVLSLPQSALESLLAAKLRERGVEVKWNHRLATLDSGPQGMLARVDRLVKESGGYAVAHTTWVVERTIEVAATFVVGADGHRSLVRRALEIPFEETAPSQVFAVFECEVARTVGDDVRLVIAPSSVNAMWPLPEGRVRWSLELEGPDVAAADRHKSRLGTRLGERFFPHLDEAHLRALLAERAPWFEPVFAGLGWTIEVRFERRLAARLGRDRTWLVGDAAHLTAPIGMQSMNVGLREAAEVADTMAAALRGEDALPRFTAYEERALAEWRFLHGTAGGLVPGEATPPFVAAHAGRLLPCLPASGEELDALARRLDLSVHRG